MKEFDVALRLKVNAPSSWDKAKVREFVDTIFSFIATPLGNMKMGSIEVKQAYIDISVIGGKK